MHPDKFSLFLWRAYDQMVGGIQKDASGCCPEEIELNTLGFDANDVTQQVLAEWEATVVLFLLFLIDRCF